jgi:hypothetical protein
MVEQTSTTQQSESTGEQKDTYLMVADSANTQNVMTTTGEKEDWKAVSNNKQPFTNF